MIYFSFVLGIKMLMFHVWLVVVDISRSMERPQGRDLFCKKHMSEIQKFEEMLAESEQQKEELQEANTRLQADVDEIKSKMAGRVLIYVHIKCGGGGGGEV